MSWQHTPPLSVGYAVLWRTEQTIASHTIRHRRTQSFDSELYRPPSDRTSLAVSPVSSMVSYNN